MKYLSLAIIMTAFAAILAYFDSKYEKLSPPGKFNKSFKANFVRNIITIAAASAFISLINVMF